MKIVLGIETSCDDTSVYYGTYCGGNHTGDRSFPFPDFRIFKNDLNDFKYLKRRGSLHSDDLAQYIFFLIGKLIQRSDFFLRT